MSIQTEQPVSRADRYQARKIELLEQIAQGGGGGGVTVEALSVTENGTYTAPEGTAYSPVTVAVSNLLADEDVTFVSAASEIQIPVAKNADSFVVVITPSDDVVTALQDSSVTSFYLTYGVALNPAASISGLGITSPGMLYRYRGSTSTGGLTTLTGISLENSVVTLTSSSSLRFYTGDYNFKIYELA